MEYLEGIDLQKLVEDFGPVTPARAVFLVLQACSSLAEAHAAQIVHRDLKPSNVFLTNRGGLCDFVKVLDFGLAKQAAPEAVSGLTLAGQVFGTPTYMSPEQWSDTGTVDPRADVYCLGLVTYYLLTGDPPFTSSSPANLLFDHMKTMPAPPSSAAEMSISPELDQIVLRCLEKRPQDRFQSMGELEAALSGVHFEEPWTRERARIWWELHDPK